MEKIISFDSVIASITVHPKVDLEIWEAEDKDYFLIECDALDDLNIEKTSNELRIDYKNQPSLGQVVGAFTDFFLKSDPEQLKNIETPHLKIKLKVFTKSNHLRVKINKGIVSVKKDLLGLELKANHLHDLTLPRISNLTLKVNHGNVALQLFPNIVAWDINLNSGNLYINKNGNECSYIARVDGERQEVGLNPKINIRINSGVLNFNDV